MHETTEINLFTLRSSEVQDQGFGYFLLGLSAWLADALFSPSSRDLPSVCVYSSFKETRCIG
jgi:hypothetical protein